MNGQVFHLQCETDWQPWQTNAMSTVKQRWTEAVDGRGRRKSKSSDVQETQKDLKIQTRISSRETQLQEIKFLPSCSAISSTLSICPERSQIHSSLQLFQVAHNADLHLFKSFPIFFRIRMGKLALPIKVRVLFLLNCQAFHTDLFVLQKNLMYLNTKR